MNGARAIPAPLRIMLLAGLGIAAVQSAMIPLSPGSGLVPPDLLYCLVVAWAVRDPATVALWLVAALGLFADTMLGRPLGLGALGLVLAAEVARGVGAQRRGPPFLLEWLAAVAGFALMLAASHVVLRLSLVEPPGLAASARHLVATALAYPIIAMVVARGVGLRAAPGA